MVMELLEGETLAARIDKGPLPLDHAITFATQVADALDRAHRAGVTHRDIKPANIMVTRDGIKVMDFGLAKSAPPKLGPTSETLTAALTTEGAVLGTPQYMSPEQFEGKEADARSDIWAFGAVLYEMLTGQKAFRGKNYSSLVGAILAADPPPMAVKPFTPSWLETLVRRCLQKDPEDRYHCMRDLVIDLKSPHLHTVSTKPVRANRWWQAIAALSILTAVIAAGFALRKPAAPLPVTLTVDPPEGGTFVRENGVAISPDGRTLAFTARTAKGERRLHVRPLDSLAVRPLQGTADASRPFWSPDSKSLVFFADNKLKKIDLAGGAPTTLCDTGNGRGGDWNSDGVILFATNTTRGIQRIQSSGGQPALVTRINREAGELFHYYPEFLPGNRDFLYLVRFGDPSKMGIAFGSLESKPDGAKPATIVAQTEYGAHYDAASRRLVYMQAQGTLMARRMELNPPRFVGDPVVIAEGVRTSSANGFAEFSLSRQGTLAYGQGVEISKYRFAWVDRSGKSSGTIGEPVQVLGPFHLSPDGTRVAYGAGPGLLQSEVWVLELARGLNTRISFNNGTSPRWSPDGKQLYYSNGSGIHSKPTDGSGEETLVAKTDIDDFVNTVSPDGNTLLIGSFDITKLPLSGGKSEPYVKTPYREVNPAFSPDGRWVAYTSNESGRSEVYIQGYPDKRGKWQVSSAGGSNPAWRQDGKELYWSGRGMLTATAIEPQAGGIRLGHSQPLFRLRSYFQPARDGQRFLVTESELGNEPDRPMVVVLNWAARLGDR